MLTTTYKSPIIASGPDKVVSRSCLRVEPAVRALDVPGGALATLGMRCASEAASHIVIDNALWHMFDELHLKVAVEELIMGGPGGKSYGRCD